MILPATDAQHYSYSQRPQPLLLAVIIFVNGSALLSVRSAALPTQRVAPADGPRDWRRLGRLLTISAEFFITKRSSHPFLWPSSALLIPD